MPSIEDGLNGLGLGKYSKAFAANDVDLRALPLKGAHLQELRVHTPDNWAEPEETPRVQRASTQP